MKKKNYLFITAAAALISVTMLAGCSGKTSAPLYETAAMEKAYQSQVSASAPMEMEPYEAAMDMEAGSGSLTSQSAMQPVNTARKLIRTASLSVETTSFDALIGGINQTITDMGGYLEQSDISGSSISLSSPGRRYAYLIARVPSDKLDLFITQVGEQGNITNKSESTQDVTLQYSDIESKKKSLTIEQERLWALLEKADTLEAVIALESRLSEIRYQLESFESQLRLYDNQVDYSTVSLNVNEVQVFTPTSPDSIAIRIQKGFSRNLANVSLGLVNFLVWFVSSLPVFLVLTVVIAIIVLIVRTVFRKKPEKHPLNNRKTNLSTGAETADEPLIPNNDKTYGSTNHTEPPSEDSK